MFFCQKSEYIRRWESLLWLSNFPVWCLNAGDCCGCELSWCWFWLIILHSPHFTQVNLQRWFIDKTGPAPDVSLQTLQLVHRNQGGISCINHGGLMAMMARLVWESAPAQLVCRPWDLTVVEDYTVEKSGHQSSKPNPSAIVCDSANSISPGIISSHFSLLYRYHLEMERKVPDVFDVFGIGKY